MVEVLELVRNFHGGKSILNILEITGSGKTAAGSVLLPLMLDQAAAGHVFQHMTGNGTGNRTGGLAVHWRLAAVGLGPQPMQDKGRMVPYLTLAGFVLRVTSTEIGRPGKRQQ